MAGAVEQVERVVADPEGQIAVKQTPFLFGSA